jgi:hypothetical protein
LDHGIVARALEAATKACAYARTSGDGATLAFALTWYARANINLGNFADAEGALIEAGAIPLLSARRRSSLTEVRVRLSLGSGDLDAAARAYEQRIAESRALGNVRDVHACMANLAIVERRRGQTARAITLVREVLPAVRSGADHRLCAQVLAIWSSHLLESNDLPDAREAAHEAIVLLAREPDQVLVTGLLEDLALIDALEGHFARAARLAAYANSALTKVGYRRGPGDQENRDKLTRLLDANLSPQDGARLAEVGATLTPEAAVAQALERNAP